MQLNDVARSEVSGLREPSVVKSRFVVVHPFVHHQHVVVGYGRRCALIDATDRTPPPGSAVVVGGVDVKFVAVHYENFPFLRRYEKY